MGTIGFRGLVLAWLLLIGLTVTPSARAGDLVSAQAFFEDRSGAMSFAEVQRQAFTPYAGVFSRGYSASTFWFRLTIDPARARGPAPVAAADRLVMRIRPPYLREVEFFDPATRNSAAECPEIFIPPAATSIVPSICHSSCPLAMAPVTSLCEWRPPAAR